MAQDASSPDPGEPKQVLLLSRIIWAGMVSTVLLFAGGVVMMTRNSGPPFPPDDVDVESHRRMMGILFATGIGMAIGIAALAIFVRGQIFKAGWIGQVVQPGSYLRGNIIAWALCEGLALYGLVLCLLGGSLWPYSLVTGAGLGLLLVLWPNGLAMYPRRDPYPAVAPR